MNELVPEGYSLVARLGRGASSVVWDASHLATGQRVALKLLEADVGDPGALRRFQRERDVMTSLAAHPGILTIFDAGIESGRPWLAMELCRRGSLAAYIAAGGPLDAATSIRVLIRIAEALDVAHQRDVVHCDIKPANILVSDEGEPAVGDFGIARVTVGRATTTTVGGFSLDHIAPELLDNGTRSPRSDVYSLGTTTWELLVGSPPFRQTADVSVAAVLTRIMRQELPESPQVPADLLDLLRAMTAKAPDDRPTGMRDVVDRATQLAHRHNIDLGGSVFPAVTAAELEIRDALSGSAGPEVVAAGTHLRSTSSSTAPPEAAVRPPASRRVLLVAAAAAMLLAGGVGTGLYVWSGDPPSSPQPVAQGLPIAPDSLPGLGVPPPVTDAPISVAAEAAPAAAPARQAAGAAAVRAAPAAPAAGSSRSSVGQIEPDPRPDQPKPPVPVPPVPVPPVPVPPVPVPPVPVPPVPVPPVPVPPVPVPPVPPLRSTDVNGDGKVGCMDVDIVKSQFNSSGSGLSGDVNGDGQVNLTDLSMVLSDSEGDGTAC